MRVSRLLVLLPAVLVVVPLKAQNNSSPSISQQAEGARSGVLSRPLPVPAPAASGFFATGSTYVSPRVTVAGVDGNAMAFGVSVERALSVADGHWGIALNVDHFSYDETGFDNSYKATTTVTPFGIMGNYHFAVANARLDPFVGLGLGYQSISVSLKAGGVSASGSANSGTYWQAQAGVRYALTDAFAIGVEAGAGVGALGITGTFRF